ncbi:MAG: 50S ribosomal protein L11 methyltransferase [Deltaproteobacteria bacterium]|nr:50S ribosomal protein L11 methyltransferase [Deltaproteobacteria bacterium]
MKTFIGSQYSRSAFPYEELYIYLLQGRVEEDDEDLFEDAFIGNWVEDDYSFLFFSKPAGDEIRRLLHVRSDLTLGDQYRFTYEEWQGGRFDAIKVDSFLITPPWISQAQEKGMIQILLDPGVVFGNGLHPTTRDCLKAIAHAMKVDRFDRVLDMGTGTGILALAAANMGAKRVSAVDLNPLCVKTAKHNVILNGLDGIVDVTQGRAEDFMNEPADLVVANIHHQVLVDLFENGSFKDKSRLILSGLMRSQAADIRSRLERHYFKLIHEWDHEMKWYTMLACNEGIRC